MSKNFLKSMASLRLHYSQKGESDESLPVEVTMSVLCKYVFAEGAISEVCGGLIGDFIASRDELVVCSRDAYVTLRCTTRGFVANRTVSLSGECTGIACIRDSLLIARGEGVCCYNADRPQTDYALVGHSVLSVSASFDNQHFVTGGSDATVSLWSVHDGHVRFFSGHTDWVRFVKFVSVNSEQLIVSAGDDGSIFLWCFRGGLLSSCEFSPGSGIRAFDAEGEIVVAASDTPALSIFNLKQRLLSESGVIPKPHTGTLTAAKLISGTQLVASAGEDECVAVSCLQSLTTIYRCSALVTRRRCISFMNTVSCICVVAAPPLSSVIILAACSSDGVILQWNIDPRSGKHSWEKTLRLHIGALTSMVCLSS